MVAIGGPAVMRAVDAYRKLVPSVVWILGLGTPRHPADPLVRSLESLVEPFVNGYFQIEAQAVAARVVAELPSHSAALGIEALSSGSVAAALAPEVTAALRMVEMLDRAHATQQVEVVVTDGSTTMAQAAMAWANARGVPALALPQDSSLRRPAMPSAGRTFIESPRARRAYAALGVAAGLVAAPSEAASESVTSVEREAAKAAVTRATGWPASDPVVVFEPAGRRRDTALEPEDSFGASLNAMFLAFATARASVPRLRLVIVAPLAADGLHRTGQSAAAAGINSSDFAYAQTDHAVWITAADIFVAVDSSNVVDAVAAGAVAINLWRAENWLLGPAFGADDGIIEITPAALGSTLGVLANDVGLRAQISAVGREKIGSEMQISAHVAVAAARAIVAQRGLAAPPAVRLKRKPDIVIYAPDYTHTSAGVRALHRLCHLINLAGGDASIYPATTLHPTWSTPRRDTDLNDRSIVLYPETASVALPSKRIVRWVLNVPGLLAGPTEYGPEEMVFYYSQGFRAAAQAATAELLTDERELTVSTLEPELYYDDRSRPRLYDCVYIGKGEAIAERVWPRELRDAFVIRRGEHVWPASRVETAALLRGCRCLYSFDAHSAVIVEAIVCGARVFLVREDGQLEEAYADMSDYVYRYYDLSQVEQFLRLVTERWD